MPYIKPELREYLLDECVAAVGEQCNGPGELNFVLTSIVLGYLGWWVSEREREYRSHWGYQELNEAVGVLECVKQELYRRSVAPYEDKAVLRNGDVYPQEERNAYP